jgi:hypothetical protein
MTGSPASGTRRPLQNPTLNFHFTSRFVVGRKAPPGPRVDFNILEKIPRMNTGGANDTGAPA